MKASSRGDLLADFPRLAPVELVQISARDEKSSRHFAVIHNYYSGAE